MSEIEWNKVIYADCMNEENGLPTLPDKSVDLCLTDPPYGVGIEYGQYKDTEINWFKLMKQFIPEIKRVVKMVIMPSCQIKRLEWIYNNFPPDWLICWFKGSVGASSFIGFNDWEPHLVYGKITNKMHDFFYASPTSFKDTVHPCPKPYKWAYWLISRSKPTSVIDPFLGSGTTAEVCTKLGIKWLGYEINEVYSQDINKRLKNCKKEPQQISLEDFNRI